MQRRKILKTAAAASILGLAPLAGAKLREPSESYDVVVVGSGAAGLCAAVAAREAGAKRVAVFEKHALVGGHSILSSGSVSVAFRNANAADPLRDLKANVREMRRVGGSECRQELIEALVGDSENAVRWLASMGVRWDKRFFQAVGGISPRCISTGSPQAGYDYVQALLRRARSLGVDFYLSTRALGLVRRDDAVTGLYVVRTPGLLEAGAMPENFAPPLEAMSIAAHGVVLATGGFGANTAMRTRWCPTIPVDFPTTASPHRLRLDGSTGDGILMAEQVGAALVGMPYIQVIPYSGGRLLDQVGGEIWINDEGRRFIPEGAPFSELRQTVTQDEGFWAISDSQTTKGNSLAVKLMQGIVKKADSLEELAKAIGVGHRTLQDTIDRWNTSVASGRDLDFDVPIASRSTIMVPPFYYGRETWSVHFTCGGIAITPHGEVKRSDGSVIAGLYAAGETTGGVHGMDRLGGNSLTDCFVFGARAGRRAAANALEASRCGVM